MLLQSNAQLCDVFLTRRDYVSVSVSNSFLSKSVWWWKLVVSGYFQLLIINVCSSGKYVVFQLSPLFLVFLACLRNVAHLSIKWIVCYHTVAELRSCLTHSDCWGGFINDQFLWCLIDWFLWCLEFPIDLMVFLWLLLEFQFSFFSSVS